MAVRPIGPFIALAVLVALAFAGSKAQTYELNEHIPCNYELARKDKPAADILFVGNSHTGAAIDPVYIESRLQRETGQSLNVERLSLAWPEVPPMRVLTREYTDHRGFPRIVVVQALFNHDAKLQSQVSKPVHPLRSLAFGRVEDLIAVQQQSAYSPDGSLLASFEKGHPHIAVALIGKFTTNIYAALRWPGRAISGTLVDCSGNAAEWQSQFWRYGDLSGNADYSKEAGTAAEVAQWRKKAVKDYLPYDPRDPARFFENDQMHRLIASFREGGSRVFLTLYPQLSANLSPDQRRQIAAEFPEATFIDGIAMAEKGGTADDGAAYRDSYHVNRTGALVLSRGFADRLAEEVR